MQNWDIGDVCYFLKQRGYGTEMADLFENEEICGIDLLEMKNKSSETLASLVPNKVLQAKLKRSIKSFARHPDKACMHSYSYGETSKVKFGQIL